MPGLPGLTSDFDRPNYLATVRRAIEYIHAGDCFQVNLAQRLLYPDREPSLELYKRLREQNPATRPDRQRRIAHRLRKFEIDAS